MDVIIPQCITSGWVLVTNCRTVNWRPCAAGSVVCKEWMSSFNYCHHVWDKTRLHQIKNKVRDDEFKDSFSLQTNADIWMTRFRFDTCVLSVQCSILLFQRLRFENVTDGSDLQRSLWSDADVKQTGKVWMKTWASVSLKRLFQSRYRPAVHTLTHTYTHPVMFPELLVTHCRTITHYMLLINVVMLHTHWGSVLQMNLSPVGSHHVSVNQ